MEKFLKIQKNNMIVLTSLSLPDYHGRPDLNNGGYHSIDIISCSTKICRKRPQQEKVSSQTSPSYHVVFPKVLQNRPPQKQIRITRSQLLAADKVGLK